MISGAATLELGAELSANVSFGADAAGTLILRDPSGFTGTISGLSSTDHIDLANISYETASLYNITHSSNTNITTLVITGGTNTDTISLLGNYTINTAWHLSDDGHGAAISIAKAIVAMWSRATFRRSGSLIAICARTIRFATGEKEGFKGGTKVAVISPVAPWPRHLPG